MPTPSKKKTSRKAAVKLPSKDALEAMFSDAPPADECQHERWTTRGNEPPGKVWCPDCRSLPKLREAFDAAILRACGVR